MVDLTSKTSQVGQPVRRTDGWEKATGAAHYAADLALPGMLHAVLIVSPYAHALITKIDITLAQKVPGVLRVVIGQDLPIKKDVAENRRRNPLAENEVVFYGQPLAVVLAESAAAAEDGAELVEVSYQPLPVVRDMLAAFKPDAPLVRVNAPLQESKGDYSSNVVDVQTFKQGDIEQGFSEAEVIVENTYHLPMVHQSYLETQTCLAVPEPGGGLVIYPSSQAMFSVRREVAAALDIPTSKVRVVLPTIGGGFGGKGAGLFEPLVAALAKMTRRPVFLTISRMQDLMAANPAPACVVEVKTGAKKDGTLVAMQARVYYDTGAYSGGASTSMFGTKLSSSYLIPNFDIVGYEIMSNRVGGGAYRAPGGPQSTFVVESQIEAIAAKLGLDSLEIRLKNSKTDNPSFAAVVEKLEESELWINRKNKGPNEGVGLAIASWATCMGPASASCRLDDDGHYTVTTGVADISGVTTSLAQIAAEVLKTDLSQITVVLADSNSAPHVGASGGSQITYNLGGAVKLASEDAREQILKLAAERLEANPSDLELVGGTISVKGAPSRQIQLKEIAKLSTNDYEGTCSPVYGRGNLVSQEWPQGYFAHLIKVRVDSDTGEVEVLNYLAVHDVGFAINPAEVVGQLHGGISQGLGWALYEQLVYNENGVLISGSLMDYALQNASMVPKIHTELVFVPSEKGPFGAKGIGEPPIVPGAGAIANAIFDAVGVRVTELPVTPERLLKAIQESKQEPDMLSQGTK